MYERCFAGKKVVTSGTGNLISLADMRSRPEEWRRVLQRGILANKVVEMQGVVMLEMPLDAKHLEVRGTS
jgi:hypothetical protein